VKLRTKLGALLAAPGLLMAMATPSHAAPDVGVIVFAGTLTITPGSGSQVGSFCFYAPNDDCDNAVPSTGVAVEVAVSADVDVIEDGGPLSGDGLRGSFTYTESCAPVTGTAATGSASIAASVHETNGEGWETGEDVHDVQWERTGLVALITGEGTGVAAFAPLGIPTCGQSLGIVVVGVVAAVEDDD